MYVEPLEAYGLLEIGRPAPGWDGDWDENRTDGVLLAAADLALRREFLDGRTPYVLRPSTSDVRMASVTWDCAIFPPCPETADVGEAFVFAGDLRKWQQVGGEHFGEPEQYLELARRLGDAAAERWRLDPDTDGYSRLQALLWSLQSARTQGSGMRVDEVMDRVGLGRPQVGF